MEHYKNLLGTSKIYTKQGLNPTKITVETVPIIKKFGWLWEVKTKNLNDGIMQITALYGDVELIIETKIT